MLQPARSPESARPRGRPPARSPARRRQAPRVFDRRRTDGRRGRSCRTRGTCKTRRSRTAVSHPVQGPPAARVPRCPTIAVSPSTYSGSAISAPRAGTASRSISRSLGRDTVTPGVIAPPRDPRVRCGFDGRIPDHILARDPLDGDRPRRRRPPPRWHCPTAFRRPSTRRPCAPAQAMPTPTWPTGAGRSGSSATAIPAAVAEAVAGELDEAFPPSD